MMSKGVVGSLTWDDCRDCKHYDSVKGCTVTGNADSYTVENEEVYCNDFK